MTADDLIQIATVAGGAIGGGGLVAIARAFADRHRAKAHVEIAQIRHDETVTPSLLGRIDALEERLDARGKAIDALQDEVRSRESDYDECKRRSARQEAEIERLRARIDDLEGQLSRLASEPVLEQGVVLAAAPRMTDHE